MFKVPKEAEEHVFGDTTPCALAYVELWTQPPNRTPPAHHGFHEVEPAHYPPGPEDPDIEQRPLYLVVRVDDIHRECQLIPKFEGPVNRLWTAENVLDACPKFYWNHYLDRETFYLVY